MVDARVACTAVLYVTSRYEYSKSVSVGNCTSSSCSRGLGKANTTEHLSIIESIPYTLMFG